MAGRRRRSRRGARSAGPPALAPATDEETPTSAPSAAPWRRSLWFWLPLLVGLILRLIHLVTISDETVLRDVLVLDARLYSQMALAVTEGDWLIGKEPFEVGPLYAYVLATIRFIAGTSTLAVFVIQACAGLASVALVTLLARRFASAAGACAAGLSFAAYAPPLMLESKLLGETWAVLALLVASFLVTADRPRPALSGAAFGAACLFRPELLVLLPLGAAWFFELAVAEVRSSDGPRQGLGAILKSKPVRDVCWWVGLGTLMVGLATARNLAVTGESVVVSAQGGVTFFQGNNPRAEGTFSVPEGFSGDKATQASESRALAERAVGHGLDVAEVNAYWRSLAWDYLASDWTRSATLLARKLGYWLSSAEPSSEYVLLAERCLAPALRFAAVPFGLFLAGLLLGARRALAQRRRQAILLLGVIAANLATALAFFAVSRYRLVAAAHLAVFVGPAWDDLAERWATRKPSGLKLPLSALAVAALSLIPWTEAERYQGAIEFYNFGGELFQQHRFHDSTRYYLSAVKVRPQNRGIRYNLARAYALTGDYDAAVRQLEKARELDPGSPQIAEYIEEYRRRSRESGSKPVIESPICEL